MSRRILIVGIVILALAAGFAWIWRSRPVTPSQPVITTPTSTTALPTSTLKNVLESKHFGFSIRYASDWLPGEHTYTALGPGHDLVGVAFAVPKKLASGTNLSTDSYIAVERATTTCAMAQFVSAPTDERTEQVGTTTWRVASASDAGAGNRYSERVSLLQSGSTCFALRLFVHSTNIDNYDPGTITAFDPAPLEDMYVQMRASFTPLL